MTMVEVVCRLPVVVDFVTVLYRRVYGSNGVRSEEDGERNCWVY